MNPCRQALKCAAMVSMSDVVRLMLRERAHLEEETATLAEATTVGDLRLAEKHTVFCVAAEEPALHAFEEMVRLSLSAAAVKSGNLIVGNLSASDIRGVLPDRFGALTLPLGAGPSSLPRHLPPSGILNARFLKCIA